MAQISQHLLHYFALLLILGWFFTQAYVCFFETKAFADELTLNYTKFHTWSQPTLKRKLWFTLPSPELLGSWKHKVTLLIGYIQVASACGLLIGVRQFAYGLVFVHTVISVLFDNPVLTQTQGAYEGKLRAAVFDMAIVGVLVMAAGVRVGKQEEKVEEVEMAEDKKEVQKEKQRPESKKRR